MNASGGPGRPDGTVAAEISEAMVALVRDQTGRGPTRVRTTLTPEVIVVTLRDALTKAERTLTRTGHATEVLAMRRAFQRAMREDMIAIVERCTGGRVEAFFSDHDHQPDIAVEVFLMLPPGSEPARDMPA